MLTGAITHHSAMRPRPELGRPRRDGRRAKTRDRDNRDSQGAAGRGMLLRAAETCFGWLQPPPPFDEDEALARAWSRLFSPDEEDEEPLPTARTEIETLESARARIEDALLASEAKATEAAIRDAMGTDMSSIIFARAPDARTQLIECLKSCNVTAPSTVDKVCAVGLQQDVCELLERVTRAAPRQPAPSSAREGSPPQPSPSSSRQESPPQPSPSSSRQESPPPPPPPAPFSARADLSPTRSSEIVERLDEARPAIVPARPAIVGQYERDKNMSVADPEWKPWQLQKAWGPENPRSALRVLELRAKLRGGTAKENTILEQPSAPFTVTPAGESSRKTRANSPRSARRGTDSPRHARTDSARTNSLRPAISDADSIGERARQPQTQQPQVVLSRADVGKKLTIMGDALLIDGVERVASWGNARHHDVVDLRIMEVQERPKGLVTLEDRTTLQNPPPGLEQYCPGGSGLRTRILSRGF